ncbi:MAG TPA: hypothetical protein VNT01_05455, partial [Symbiobacteriaceae bacterium]|nr:hypothetical protein [Symbiobacteriaceae bacterium]
GVELGYGLCLRASYIMAYQKRQTLEGLTMVDEALALGADCPDLQMKCTRDGLGLCFHMGDVHRATKYESLGHQLLRDRPDDPEVQTHKPRFYFNLAHIVSMRQNHAHAYWLLVQGSNALHAQGTDGDKRASALAFYLRISEVSLTLGRTPEADEALQKAKSWVSTNNDESEWLAFRASYLVRTNQHQLARELLDAVPEAGRESWRPSTQVNLLLQRSLVAQAQGDIRAFHHYTDQAQKLAVEHAVDYLLCRLQRIMGTPAKMEANTK